MNARDYVMKTAEEKMVKHGGFGIDSLASAAKAVGSIAPLLNAGIVGGYALRQLIARLQNDNRRKAIIEDLSATDSMLKEVDRERLLEWYATIYHYAPKMSLDKVTVRELLQQFARFGRIDLQTLKTMAETEKALSQSKSSEGIKNKLF